MCRINGIFSKKVVVNIEQRINCMNDSVYHGGPDAGGLTVIKKEYCGVGHRRLAVIDLDSRANQPFMLDNGEWIIVYNGEIYNYLELKKELHYDFKTKSDTEVLLAGIAEQGIDTFIKKCNGMFAFAAYDIRNDLLYLCRDRLGIKPLFYYQDENYLIFSSEIKGILNSGLVEAQLNTLVLDDYLGYRYVREPYTFFKGIKQVKAGTYLEYHNNLQKEARFWDIPFEFNMNSSYSEKEILEEFFEKLHESVMKRTISDVAVGTYLSGGVDSSLLSAIVAESRDNYDLNTYTIGFQELNEFVFARAVADKYKTNHHEILICSKDYMDKIDEIVGYKDAPLGVPNEIPLAIMSKELKKKITVVLSGEGADELLGGYGKIYRSPFDYENLIFKSQTFYDFFVDRYEYTPRIIRNKYLKEIGNNRDLFDKEIKDRFNNNCNEYNVFWFFHKFHVKGLLQRVDTTTMLAAVEARVPFLDHNLVEYSYKNIPYNLKLHWNNKESQLKAKNMNSAEYSEILDTPKYLLKKLALQWLPEETVLRKKMGFPVPLDKWKEELKIMAKKYLEDAVWLKNKNIDKLIIDLEDYKIGYQMLWMFINIEVFYQKYFTKEWRY